MLDFLILFKDQIIVILQYMFPIILVSFMALGIVSIFGRLLELTNTDHSKNILAFISMLFLSYAYQKQFTSIDFNVIWDTIELTTISAIFYVAVCWRFYSRIDHLLDRWFGEDSFKPTKPKRKKK